MWWLLLLILVLLRPAYAEDIQLVPCGEINFFAPACTPSTPPPAPVAVLQEAPAPVPLFPPQIMAPDTPPLMYQLLEEPTLANAQKFLAWQVRRQQRIAEVQQLLHALTRQERKGE